MVFVRLDCEVCGKLIENGQEAVRIDVGVAGSQIFGFFRKRVGYQVAHKKCLNVQADDESQYARFVLDAVADHNTHSAVLDLQERVDDLENDFDLMNEELMTQDSKKLVSCMGCGNVYDRKLSKKPTCPVCDNATWTLVTPSDIHE